MIRIHQWCCLVLNFFYVGKILIMISVYLSYKWLFRFLGSSCDSFGNCIVGGIFLFCLILKYICTKVCVNFSIIFLISVRSVTISPCFHPEFVTRVFSLVFLDHSSSRALPASLIFSEEELEFWSFLHYLFIFCLTDFLLFIVFFLLILDFTSSSFSSCCCCFLPSAPTSFLLLLPLLPFLLLTFGFYCLFLCFFFNENWSLVDTQYSLSYRCHLAS